MKPRSRKNSQKRFRLTWNSQSIVGLQHPALMKSSGWSYSQELRQILAARWWGCPTIGTFKSLSKPEKIKILAAYEADWRIKAINNYEMQQEAERNSKRGSK